MRERNWTVYDVDHSLVGLWRTLRRGTPGISPGRSSWNIRISLLVSSALRVRSLERDWGIRSLKRYGLETYPECMKRAC